MLLLMIETPHYLCLNSNMFLLILAERVIVKRLARRFKFQYDTIKIQIALIELAKIYYLNSIVLLLRYVLFIEHYVVSTTLCYHTTFDMSTIIFIQLFQKRDSITIIISYSFIDFFCR